MTATGSFYDVFAKQLIDMRLIVVIFRDFAHDVTDAFIEGARLIKIDQSGGELG